MKPSIKIGLIGLGTVGAAVLRILTEQRDLIQRRLGYSLDVVQVADPDAKKRRGLPRGVGTNDAQAILRNPEIDIVVELIGGIHPAREYLLDAIGQGKHVVTANKKLLAEHGDEIFRAAADRGVDIGFEASVCGAIPIIRTIREGFASEHLSALFGIVNGTCNFILTRMSDAGLPFADALAEAQAAGYAERDPTLDVGGGDSAHKLAILARLAFDTPVALKEIYTEGVDCVLPRDIAYADELGYKIKLLAIAKREDGAIEARVHPTLIPKSYLLSTVSGVHNAVYLIGESVGESLLYGRGAGGVPTGSAVVSDLMDIARNIQQRGEGGGASGRVSPASFQPDAHPSLRIRGMAEIECRYYLRFTVQDRPGVLSKISGVLGRFRIGIASVIQQGRAAGGNVPLVMMTYRARERDMRAALSRIDRMDEVAAPTVLIRVEERHD
jgi:homoserine dehydrogenase